MKKALSLILALVLLIGLLPQFTLPARAEETEAATNGLAGKTISILGDSISTYTGVSNNAAYNATLSGGAIYYTEGRLGVYQEDTWWQQAIDTLGLELTVNNSWSGSCIFNTRAGTVGAYVDRSVQLHNTEGEEPDMIVVYLGTNDFCNYKSTLGTSADIDYVSLITETEDGYTYATPTTAAEAYAIMLHKAAVRYPDSEIYCFTLLPQRISNTNVELLEQFNQTLLEIAEHFGAYGVDLYHDSGIKNDDNFATYVADNSLHPGPAGMDAITGCFISSILENSQYVAADVHSITYDLDNVIVDQGTAYAIMDGDTFSCTLTAPAGYDLSVSVTMGSTDITASCYANGKITISSVTADIAIAASAALPVKEAENYRWEFNGSDLVSVTTGNNTPNALTRLAGSITDGVHTHSRFQMSENVVLYHDRPWTIEWKSAGTWTDTTDGALLFAGATTSNTADTPYIYRRHKSDFIAIGVYTGGRYHNYGVALSTSGIDATIDHVYRMENQVAADSTNMVYLYVDGVEIGPMNHHWIGGTDQNETVDWVNGRDFVFSYMGTTPHTIGNCSINYIQVIECVHTYKNSICTAPTCTEKGYTTHTCNRCGHSKVDSYVDALGHDYKDTVTDPTCTEQGYTTHTCNRCNDSYVDSYVDALGHKTRLKNAKEATCTEAGYTGDEACTVCGETVKKGEAIPLYWKVPTTQERSDMKENNSNGLENIISQAIEEMKSEQGNNFSLEKINLAELERRTSISRAKLRRLKENGFVFKPHKLRGKEKTHLPPRGYYTLLVAGGTCHDGGSSEVPS